MDEVGTDSWRADKLGEYVRALESYLGNHTEEGREAVLEAAHSVDQVRGRGYLTGPTSLREGCEEKLDRLVDGDKPEWGKLLNEMRTDKYYYPRFCALSPFKGEVLVLNHDLRYFGSFFADLLALADPEFDKDPTYRADYLLEIPSAVMDMIKVHRVREPRNQRVKAAS